MCMYSAISKVYDLLEVLYFRKKERSPREAMIKHIPEGKVKVLDICTGTATNNILIAEKRKEAQLYGIDISKEMLKIADKKILKKNINNIKNYIMDATNIKFERETFDIVIVSLVLHEIDDKLASNILNEAKRVLKPNGRILVLEWEKPNTLLKNIIFLPILLLEPKGFKEFIQKDFNKYFSEKDLEIEDIEQCDYSRVFIIRALKGRGKYEYIRGNKKNN